MNNNNEERTLGRQLAVTTLYSLDFNDQLSSDIDLTVFPGMTQEETDDIDEGAKTFARYIVLGTLEKLEEIDALISKYSINRPISKINIVDRNVLRISFFQLLNLKDTHPTIIIDQAVKLSQSLSNDVSYKFINGILDTYVKDQNKNDRT